MKPKAKDYRNIFEYCEALEKYIEELEAKLKKIEDDWEDEREAQP